MKLHKGLAILIVSLLSACGGGGSSSASGDGNSQSVTFKFVPQAWGEIDTYTIQETDFAGNAGTYNLTVEPSKVNSDGSYILTWIPAQSTYSRGGVQYPLIGENDLYDSAGDILQYTPINAANFSCYYDYTSGPSPTSMVQGQSYTISDSSHCTGDTTTITNTGNGTFIGTESITVPAGTFNAYKFQNTWTSPITYQAGASTTIVNTVWLDTSPTTSRTLRRITQYGYVNFTPIDTWVKTEDEQLSSYK